MKTMLIIFAFTMAFTLPICTALADHDNGDKVAMVAVFYDATKPHGDSSYPFGPEEFRGGVNLIVGTYPGVPEESVSSITWRLKRDNGIVKEWMVKGTACHVFYVLDNIERYFSTYSGDPPSSLTGDWKVKVKFDNAGTEVFKFRIDEMGVPPEISNVSESTDPETGEIIISWPAAAGPPPWADNGAGSTAAYRLRRCETVDGCLITVDEVVHWETPERVSYDPRTNRIQFRIPDDWPPGTVLRLENRYHGVGGYLYWKGGEMKFARSRMFETLRH